MQMTFWMGGGIILEDEGTPRPRSTLCCRCCH